MSIWSEAEDVFAEGASEDGLGKEFSYDGEPDPYRGVFDLERLEYVMEDVGQREVVRRNLVAVKSQWDTKPDAAQGPEIVFEGNTYVIASVGEDGVNYLFTLEKRT